MTNREKFESVMKETFKADSIKNYSVMIEHCPPVRAYFNNCSSDLACEECEKWWDKEYVDMEEVKKESLAVLKIINELTEKIQNNVNSIIVNHEKVRMYAQDIIGYCNVLKNMCDTNGIEFIEGLRSYDWS